MRISGIYKKIKTAIKNGGLFSAVVFYPLPWDYTINNVFYQTEKLPRRLWSCGEMYTDYLSRIFALHFASTAAMTLSCSFCRSASDILSVGKIVIVNAIDF